MLGLALDVVFVYLQLQEELSTLGLSVQPTKCVVWFPQGLDHSISLLPGFLTPDSSFCILGALVGATSFVELFEVEVFHEDLGMIFSLLMFTNPHVVFVMF
jgi:hypothetical protein